jgi:N-acetylglucosamine kinase-like BadF-type ATPase
LISAAAEEGDAVATRVLLQAAADLAEFILLVRRKLREQYGLVDEVPVVWTGSVLEKIGMIRERVTETLRLAAPQMPFSQQGVVAVEGAVWRAQRLAGR